MRFLPPPTVERRNDDYRLEKILRVRLECIGERAAVIPVKYNKYEYARIIIIYNNMRVGMREKLEKKNQITRGVEIEETR